MKHLFFVAVAGGIFSGTRNHTLAKEKTFITEGLSLNEQRDAVYPSWVSEIFAGLHNTVQI